MRVLAVDLETSGLDKEKDEITEIGWCLYDTDRCSPLVTGGGLVAPTSENGIVALRPEIVALNGITNEDRCAFGASLAARVTALSAIAVRGEAEWFVAHNAPFDMGFLLRGANPPEAWLTIHSLPWIDTRTDLPLAEEATSSRLQHLLADHGIIQPFRHRALFDALGCCLLLAKYPIEEVVRRAKAPTVTLIAQVSYDDRELAKARRYRWDGATKTWSRKLKDFEAAAEIAAAPFAVTVR